MVFGDLERRHFDADRQLGGERRRAERGAENKQGGEFHGDLGDGENEWMRING
jgi:hypothetical protein